MIENYKETSYQLRSSYFSTGSCSPGLKVGRARLFPFPLGVELVPEVAVEDLDEGAEAGTRHEKILGGFFHGAKIF